MEWKYSRRDALRTVAGGAVVCSVLGTATTATATTDGGEELWRYTSTEKFENGPTVVDGVVYAARRSGGRTYAIDAQSGEDIWAKPPDEGSTSAVTSPIVVDGIFYFEGGNTVTAIDAESGEEEWVFDSEDSEILESFRELAFADGELYIQGEDTLVALDVESREERVVGETDEQFDEPMVIVGDTIYVGGRNRDSVYLYAFDTETGDERWRVTEGDENFGTPTPPTVAGGMVYAGGAHREDGWGVLTAHEVDDGTEVWEFEVEERPTQGPTVANGTVYVGVSTGLMDDDVFYALDADSGEELWQFVPDASLQSDAPPTVADGVVYFGTQDGALYALDTDDGEEHWHIDIDEDIDSPPIVADGTIYVTVERLRDDAWEEGDVVAIGAVGEGSSEDSRVLHATYNHHEAWTGDSSAVEALLAWEDPESESNGDDVTGDDDGATETDNGSTGNDGTVDGDDGSPGFGIGATVSAIGGGAYVLKRRLGSRNDE